MKKRIFGAWHLKEKFNSSNRNVRVGVEGELTVLQELDRVLPTSSIIISNPQIGGLDIDILVVDQNEGFFIIEVKNWYAIKKIEPNGNIHIGENWRNPLEQAKSYIHPLSEQLSADGKRDTFRLLTAVVAIPSMTRQDFLMRKEVADWSDQARNSFLRSHFFAGDFTAERLFHARKYQNSVSSVFRREEFAEVVRSLVPRQPAHHKQSDEPAAYDVHIPAEERMTSRPGPAKFQEKPDLKRKVFALVVSVSFLAVTGLAFLNSYIEEQNNYALYTEKESSIPAEEDRWEPAEEDFLNPEEELQLPDNEAVAENSIQADPESNESAFWKGTDGQEQAEMNLSQEQVSPEQEVESETPDGQQPADAWNEDVYEMETSDDGYSGWRSDEVGSFGNGGDQDDSPFIKTESAVTLGSTQEQVRQIMGTPDEVNSILNSWSYRRAIIQFNDRGTVEGWNNWDGVLKVSLGEQRPGTHFSLNSSKADVVLAMGTPDEINAILDIWSYGRASVSFEEGRVIEWNKAGDPLRVSIGNPLPGAYFTIGSTQQEVVDAMGTPDEIIDVLNLWSYDRSTVEFGRDGTVSGWDNWSENLKIR